MVDGDAMQGIKAESFDARKMNEQLFRGLDIIIIISISDE